MKSTTKRFLITSFTFVVLSIVFGWLYLAVHEQVHVAILRSYNIESITSLNWGSGATIPVNVTDYQIKCNPECKLANNLTDVVGYHVALLICVLTGLFYILQVSWLYKEKKDVTS